jgi:hypothetical protein
MTFLETIAKAGYTLALALFKRIHGDSFSDGFSFEEWHDVVKTCQKHNDGFWLKIADKELYRSARTYQQWKIVRNFVPHESPAIAEQLFTTISSFEECVDFKQYHFGELCLADPASNSVALVEKALKWAHSFEDWHWIRSTIYLRNAELQSASLAKMEELASNFGEMMWLYRYATDDEMRARIFDKLVVFTQTAQ